MPVCRVARAASALLGFGAAASAGVCMCIEDAPGSVEGRRRLRPSLALAAQRLGLDAVALSPPTGAELARLKPEFAEHFSSKWGPASLPVPPPGHVHVSWSAGCFSGPHALPAEVRQAVDDVATQLSAALTASSAHQEPHGWHIEVVPSDSFYCGTRQHCVVLTTHTIAACWCLGAHHGSAEGAWGTFSSNGGSGSGSTTTPSPGPKPALLWLMGHEVAHGLAQHTVEKAAFFTAQMMLFCWQYIIAEGQYIIAEGQYIIAEGQCLLGCGSSSSSPGWGWPARPQHAQHAQHAQRAAALGRASAQLKLQVAASLQQLSWQHELEADTVACQLLAAAGVPAQHWRDGLAVLQQHEAGEQQQREEGRRQRPVAPPRGEANSSGSGGGAIRRMQQAMNDCQGSVEAEGAVEAEAEEALGWQAAAQLLLSRALARLAAGQMEEAQQILDGSLRWPLPVGWLRGLAPAEQVQLLSCALQTHPPLAVRAAHVRQLAGLPS